MTEQTFKEKLRTQLRERARGQRRESALRTIAGWGEWGQRVAGFVAPRPEQFAADDCRHVLHFGVDWRLFPAHYFQWHQYFGFADPVHRVLMQVAAKSRYILDIGANIGFYSVGMARQTHGTVYAFEPVPSTFARLAEHTRGVPNVQALQLAMADRVGHAQIFDGGTADSGKASLREGAVGRSQSVPTCSIDAFCEEKQLPSVDLIKIDVEGLEAMVLKGGLQCIQRCRPALCLELSPEWMTEVDRALFEQLGQMGYRFEEITNNGRRPITLGTAWGRGQQTNLLLQADRAGASRTSGG